MLFLEGSARALLVVHGLLAVVLLGAASHQALWALGYLRGRWERQRAERRIVPWVVLLFWGNLVGGALLYPVYKVRVRAEYLDAPAAVAADVGLRSEDAARAGTPRPRGALLDLGWVARLFDVKEHLAALGGYAALVLWWLARRAHPSLEPRLALLYVGLSVFVAASAWTGAAAGLLTASYRSIGAFGGAG